MINDNSHYVTSPAFGRVNAHILYILLGILLVFLGYYRGEVYPAWYTLIFSIGILIVSYNLYSYYYNYRYRVKDIY
jgi:hypothetical protein